MAEALRVAFDPHCELHTVLEDGTRLLMRSLRPADEEAVAEAFRHLSPDAIYFRFWSRFREVNPRLIEQICSPDQKDHAGWVILHESRTDIPCVAGASLWRMKDEPEVAEVSFTVADEFQERGLGTLLLAVLWEHAAALGIQKLVGHVLRENIVMRAWWSALGATEVSGQRHYVITLLLDEALLEGTSAADRLRQKMAWVRTCMNEGAPPDTSA